MRLPAIALAALVASLALAGSADAPPAIDWLGWSDATFQHARTTGRPVLLYLDAAWSGRCRAFEAALWDDPEIRRVVSEAFVPIRVDRDRRPDIFARYERGGAPSVAFLIPSGDALFLKDARGFLRAGGAAFSRDEMLRYLDLVRRYYEAAASGLEKVAEDGRQRVLEMRKSAGRPLTPEMAGLAANAVLRAADPIHGGLMGPGRLPAPSPVRIALEQAVRGGEADYRLFARRTLDAMARSPLRDPLSGAFRPEARAPDWSLAEPARLLQTQGEMLRLYLLAYRALGDPRDRAVADGICSALLRDFFVPELRTFRASVFPAAGEGEPERLDTAGLSRLGKHPREALTAYLGLDPSGRPAEPRLALDPAEVAARLGNPLRRVEGWLRDGIETLRAARRDGGDETVLSGATAEAAAGLLEAAAVLDRPEAGEAARTALAYLAAQIFTGVDPALHGMEVRPARPIPTFLLADQISLAEAWMAEYELTGEPEARRRAEQVADLIRTRFADPATAALRDRLPSPSDVGDLRIPDRRLGENGRAAQVLLQIDALRPGHPAGDAARGILESLADEFPAYGVEAAEFGIAVGRSFEDPLRILVVDGGRAGADPLAGELRRAALASAALWRGVLTARPEADGGMLRGLGIRDTTTAAYLLLPGGASGPFRRGRDLAEAIRGRGAATTAPAREGR